MIGLSTEFIAVVFLGAALVVLATGCVVALLASLGFHTYLKAQDNKKKIEVRTKNSNLK